MKILSYPSYVGLLGRQYVVVQRGLEMTLAPQESSVTKSYGTLPGDDMDDQDRQSVPVLIAGS